MSQPGESGLSPDRMPRSLARQAGEFGFWQWRNVAINVWLVTPSPESVERLIALTRDVIAQHPEGFSAVHYVHGGISLPGAPTRDALARLASVSDGAIRCVGLVLSRGGFWASTMRSAVTGIQLVSRVRFSIRICTGVDQVLAWMPREHAQQTGVAVPPEQLASAIHYAIEES